MNKVYFFGKLSKTIYGQAQVLIPTSISSKLNMDSHFIVIIEELKELEKRDMKRSRDANKVCVGTTSIAASEITTG